MGVPQGPILVPFQFLFYTTDLTYMVRQKSVMFTVMKRLHRSRLFEKTPISLNLMLLCSLCILYIRITLLPIKVLKLVKLTVFLSITPAIFIFGKIRQLADVATGRLVYFAYFNIII